MKILAAASEIYPLVKTGGLADVVGALPGALLPLGIEVRSMVPGYPAVIAELKPGKIVHRYAELFGGRAALVAGKAKGLDVIALDAPHLFNRPGNIYLGPDGKDWPDNGPRFAAFSQAIVDVARGAIKDYAPDILHLHDWQAALAAVHVKFGGGPKTVVTVHNIAFQGQFPAPLFASLGLPPAAFGINGVEFYGNVGFLKGGLACADAITTVSPSYANEICTPEFGMGLDGLLRSRREVVSGIVNGIDTDVWNPRTDADIAARFDASTLERRGVNKREIEKRFGLAAGDGPLFCVVSRLTWQKGMDVLAAALDALVDSGARLALVGSGESGIEREFLGAAQQHKGRIGAIIGYDEALSHLLQAGADAILIPSRFEPCGLTQLYGLRYGCVPVVARTGGLADTIIDANDAALGAGVATGFQFSPVDGPSLQAALGRAARLYKSGKAWSMLQKRGMQSDVSWKHSAQAYKELFNNLPGGAA
jgi:starch synthase